MLVLAAAAAIAAGRAGVVEAAAAAWNSLGPIGELGAGITPGICTEPNGTIHIVYMDRLWYSTDQRAMRGESVVLGPAAGNHVGEYTYPTLYSDARRRILVAYRDHSTGEGRLTVLDADGLAFAAPVTFAAAITRRLRWNAPLAAAPRGGVFVIWESDGRIFLRSVGFDGQSRAR